MKTKMALNENMKLRLRLAFGLLIFFMDSLCYAVVGPFYPIEALDKGMSKLMLGITIGATDVSGLLTSLTSVFFGTKNKYILFICGSAMRGMITVCFGFTVLIKDLMTFSAVCVLLRLAQGVGCFLVFSCGMPLLVSMDPQQAAMISGLISAADSAGCIFGPSIGSLLYAEGGFVFPFLMAGSLTMVFAVPAFAIFRNASIRNSEPNTPPSLESIEKDSSDPAEPLLGYKDEKSFKDFILNPKVIICVLPFFVAAAMLNYFVTSFSPYLEEVFDIHCDTVGYYIMSKAISTAVGCSVVGRLTKAGYGIVLHAFMPFITAILFFCLFLPAEVLVLENIYYVITLYTIFGICFAVPSVVVLLVCEKVAFQEGFCDMEKTKQYVATLWSVTFACGRLFGSFVIGGVVLNNFGFYWTNVVLSALFFITANINMLFLAHLGLVKKSFYVQQGYEKI